MALAGKMSVDDVPAPSAPAASPSRCNAADRNDKIDAVESPLPVLAEAEPLRWLLQCWAELVHSHAIEYVGPDRPVLPGG